MGMQKVCDLCRLVSCEPDVTRRKLLPGDAFMIVASDGLWDALTDQHAVDIAAVRGPPSP